MSFEYDPTHNSKLKTRNSRPKVLANLFVVGKLTRFQFRIYQLAVNADFEAAAVRWYEG